MLWCRFSTSLIISYRCVECRDYKLSAFKLASCSNHVSLVQATHFSTCKNFFKKQKVSAKCKVQFGYMDCI